MAFCRKGYNFRGCKRCNVSLNNGNIIRNLTIKSIFDISLGICKAAIDNNGAVVSIPGTVFRCDGVLFCDLSFDIPNEYVFYTNKLVIKSILSSWYRINAFVVSDPIKIDVITFMMFLSSSTCIEDLYDLCYRYFVKYYRYIM